MSGIQTLPLEAIVLSDMNPRRIANEAALAELAESIRQVGVLSPILVRPHKRGYELICGSRRYRASRLAGMTEIPAITRELTDNEAIELMITENLQREDVSPLEEAEAFQNLITHRGYDIAALVARFGKSEFFIRTRLKLNELIPEFKELLVADTIGVSHAMELCKLDEKYQKAIFQEKFADQDAVFTVKELKRIIDNNFTLSLYKAAFDTSDTTLDSAAGSCLTCPRNTSSNLILFPDSPREGVCLDRACFKHKTDIHFDRIIKKTVEEEPDIILATESYHNKAEAESLRKQGFEIEEVGYMNYRSIEEPEKPEEPEREVFDSEEDYQEALLEHQDEMTDYENDLAEYKEEIQKPEVRKALMVTGSQKGEIYYLVPKFTTEDSADSSTDQLISELEAKSQRAKELEYEKNYEAAKELLSTSYKRDATEIHPAETIAIYAIMLEAADENLAVKLAALTDNPKKALEYRYIKREYRHEIAAKLKHDQFLLSQLIRSFIFNQCQTSNPGYERHKADSLIAIAIEKFPTDMKEAISENRAKYLKKQESIQRRIEELKGNTKNENAKAE